jgi:hypothetical protein
MDAIGTRSSSTAQGAASFFEAQQLRDCDAWVVSSAREAIQDKTVSQDNILVHVAKRMQSIFTPFFSDVTLL